MNTKILLRCGGTLNLSNNESNCGNTVAVSADLLSLGAQGMSNALERIVRWRFSARVMFGTTTLQPVCPECASCISAGDPP